MGGVPPSVTGAAAAPTAASTTVTVGEAPVKAVPEKLQDLSRPVVLPGTVAGETADGLTRVRTQAGEVVLKSPLPLLTDRPVTLQIAAGQPPSLATILAPPTSIATPQAPTPAPTPAVLVQIGGTPAQPPATPALTTTPPPTPATGAGTPAPAPPVGTALPAPAPSLPIQPGALLPAVVLAVARNAPAPPSRDAAGLPQSPTVPAQPARSTGAAPAPTTPAPTTPASAPASPPADGGMASAVLNALTAPPDEGNPVALGGDAAHPGGDAEQPPPQPPAAKGEPKGDSPARPALRPGGTVAVRILSVEPPTTQPPPLDGDPPAPEAPDGTPPGSVVVRGTVAGTSGEGRPILATRLGMLALGQGDPLPKGTVLTVALSDPGTVLEGIAGRDVFLASSRQWPALREALVTLAGIDRTLAQSLMNTVVPQPNRRMAAAVSFFLTAVRGGDARAWLGDDAVEALRRNGRADLIQALDQEFRGMQQQAADPLPGGWFGFTLPVFDGSMLQPVRLHLHPVHDEGDGKAIDKDRQPKGSRFVIDVDLSRLGPLQLDGMVRDRRFDLILRSRTPLAPALRDELTGVFTASVGAVGFAGSLLFQNDSRQWVSLVPGGGPRLGVTA